MDSPGSTPTQLSLVAELEALLFVAPGSVTPAQLAMALDVPTAEIEKALDVLAAEYQDKSEQRGLRLQRHRGRVQLTTAAEISPQIERFLGLDAFQPSQPGCPGITGNHCVPPAGYTTAGRCHPWG